jgi:hypothetical protein
VKAFETSEPGETRQVAVVFGSSDGIVETMQAARHYNMSAVLQWLFVLLDMPRDLSFLGTCTVPSLPLKQACQTIGSHRFIMWPRHVLICTIFYRHFYYFYNTMPLRNPAKLNKRSTLLPCDSPHWHIYKLEISRECDAI